MSGVLALCDRGAGVFFLPRARKRLSRTRTAVLRWAAGAGAAAAPVRVGPRRLAPRQQQVHGLKRAAAQLFYL